MPVSSTHHKSPLRILLWAPKGSGQHYHGPGTFAFRLYSTASSGQFNLTLAHGFGEQPTYSLFCRQHFIADASPQLLPLRRFLRKAQGWLKQHAHEFDIFYGLMAFHHTVPPAYMAEQAGLPAVVWVANHRVELSDKSGLKRLLGLPKKRRKLIKQISGIIAMSSAIHEELLEYGVEESRIARIPMSVDADRFQPAPDSAARTALRRNFGWQDVPTLLFVGGIEQRKRPHLLLEAVAIARAQRLECQLVLAGPDHDPPYIEQMKARSRELGIDSQIIWFGFTKDIAPLFQASDIFALVSEREGMPAAVVEAMASGLPSIVTAISGCSDLIEDGADGRIVHPNSEDVGRALVDYLKEPATAASHGRAAREKVLQRYSATAILDAYDRLFRRLMAGGSAAE